MNDSAKPSPPRTDGPHRLTWDAKVGRVRWPEAFSSKGDAETARDILHSFGITTRVEPIPEPEEPR